MTKRMLHLGFHLGLLAALLTLPGAYAQTSSPPAAAGVAVTGSGIAYGAPDLAVLDLGVDVVDEDVRAALDEAARAMQAVMDALLAAGVAEEDIQTQALNVWREERYDDDGNPTAPRYRVVNTFAVTVRDVDGVGSLLVEAIEAGANNVGGIAFTIRDRSALEAQARERAMEQARAKAEQLAALAGVTLGAPLEIDESVGAPAGPAMYDRAEAMMAAPPAAPPVAGGQLAVQVTVTVRWAIGEASE